MSVRFLSPMSAETHFSTSIYKVRWATDLPLRCTRKKITVSCKFLPIQRPVEKQQGLKNHQSWVSSILHVLRLMIRASIRIECAALAASLSHRAAQYDRGRIRQQRSQHLGHSEYVEYRQMLSTPTKLNTQSYPVSPVLTSAVLILNAPDGLVRKHPANRQNVSK